MPTQDIEIEDDIVLTYMHHLIYFCDQPFMTIICWLIFDNCSCVWGQNGCIAYFFGQFFYWYLFSFSFHVRADVLNCHVIQVHFRGYPSNILTPCEGEDAVKWSFINSLKEVSYKHKYFVVTRRPLNSPYVHSYQGDACTVIYSCTSPVLVIAKSITPILGCNCVPNIWLHLIMSQCWFRSSA